MSPRIVFLTMGLILGFGGAAAAHHSNAAYDLDHPQTVEGTVKTVNWTNPHITFVVEPDVKNAEPASTSTSTTASTGTGTSTSTWVFEVSSPGVLTRSGWTKRSLQPGDHAVFRYAPLRDGNPGGFLLKVTLPSGQELSYSLTPPTDQ
ncbi:MAG: hypothetical protein QOD56_1665 [Gammaproteobacteria bacterium]|nr:hypothetical protein [Gammaproteobacteria bacterium]